MPRSSLNLILLIGLAALVRYFFWYYFDWTIENSELLTVIGAGATASVGYSLISDAAKNWFKSIATLFFSSARTTKYLFILSVILFVSSLSVARIDVVHSFGQDVTASVNGKQEIIEGNGEHSRKKNFGLSLTPFSITVGRYSSEETFYPLKKSEIDIPFNVSTELDMDLQRIEGQLAYGFFQFYESKYLASAEAVISAQADERIKQRALKRLSLIAQILKLSIVGGDVSGARHDLIHRFNGSYPNDGWSNILHASVSYADGKYLEAANLISDPGEYESNWPGKLAQEFFKSVCLLKSSRGVSGQIKEERLKQALEGFQLTEEMASKQQKSPYRDHALASAVIFQGIHSFYLQDIEGAKKEFQRATQFAQGSLRARAFNGAGYLEFIQGNLQEAELALLDALESDPNFAYALSNYGYVLMAKDDFETAIKYFERNAKSEELRANSYRDVLLAELAVGHAREEITKDTEKIADYYSGVLGGSGRRDFFGVSPINLRMAYQYTEMAEKVYLSKDYYGLEVFALALLSKARSILDEIRNPDARAKDLLEKATNLMNDTKPSVPIAWLKDDKDRGKFFSWIKKY